MTQRAAAPIWVRALLVLILAVAAVPGWLYAAGYATTAILFKGAESAPKVELMTWPNYYTHHRHVKRVAGALKLGGLGATVPFALL